MINSTDLQAPNWDNLPAIELLESPVIVNRAAELFMPGHCLQLTTNCGELLLQITDMGVRLATVNQRQAVGEYRLLDGQPRALDVELVQSDTQSTLNSEEIRVCVDHAPFALSFYVGNDPKSNHPRLQTTTDGHFIRKFRVPPLAKNEVGWWLNLALSSGEAVYGLGEKWGALNKRGELLRSHNQDALGVNAERSYKNAPFAWSPEGWGLFSHTPSSVTHAVGCPAWSQRSYCSVIEDECLDVFLFFTPSGENNNAAAILSTYTKLTGRAPMPPRWSNGVILSKAYYRTSDEILDAARQVRQRQMPCDVITFDGRAWQDTDTRFAFEWDASRYPDPGKIIDQLKAQDFKICVWEYPLISNKHAWFNDFQQRGWLLMDQRNGEVAEYEWDRGPFGEVLTPLPTSGIVDFTHPEAYQFWREAHKSLFDLGVDMIKADFGEQIEPWMVGHNGETGAALHNVYAYMYNKCVFEAAEMYSNSGSFLFSRAAWIGSQRFNSHWGGDPQADWEGMISNIRGGLSWGLTGSPFFATDVGGFYKDTRDDTLYVRWAQAGIFSAHFRLHGIGPREPWSYSPAAEAAAMKALKLRYRLLAYLERAQLQATQTGLPVQRPMVLAFPQDKPAWAFENQFMFGDELLVVPCFDPSGNVEFYLPEGEWFRFNPESTTEQSTALAGRRVYQRHLALDEIAVFARREAKIPLCKPMEFTHEHGDEFTIEAIWSPSDFH